MVTGLTLTATVAVAQDEVAAEVGAVIGGALGLLIAVVVGAVVGWLAGLIVKGGGSGLWGNILYGIGGSILAGFVLPALGISLGGTAGSLIAMLIGAIALILIVRAIRGSS